MNKLIECVPNFSEGRDKKVIEAIADAIRNTSGVKLLDVDPGYSTNRTVYTFVGDPSSVVEGAINAAKVAKELIDMTKHTGEHPRMGAMDVCPFIPVRNVTMQECVDCSLEFGRRMGEELGLPIYLYEEASNQDYRKSLPDIRKGEYEGFAQKIYQPEWKPDFGPATFNPTWGATVTGARKFLIAYNVNIIGTNNQAHRIALNLRELGRGGEDAGKLKDVKAIGWWVNEYNMAQVSMNLTDYHKTAPHQAYESCKEEASNLNVAVAGSELVGLIPLEALLMAADYYIQKENLFIIDENQKIRLAIERMGLNSISNFDPNKRIIEYLIKEEPNEPLASMTVRGFIEEVGARTAAPGGGSVSAAIASMGVALANMVAKLTYGVRKFEHLDGKMREIIPNLDSTFRELITKIDEDTNAFNDYIAAIRLPQNTDEEKQIRENEMQNGLKKAINTPLSVMRLANSIWYEFEEAAKVTNYASKSDLEVGVKALETGIWGAYRNVMINMKDITDQEYINTVTHEAKTIYENAVQKTKEILEILDNRVD